MATASVEFNYEQAFAANIGLLTASEQEALRKASVAIPGMGGVGGAYLLALTRLGVGHFAIADPDVFELRNFNRQMGARLQTIGRPKAEVMAAMARDINPEVSLQVFAEEVGEANIHAFLSGADVVLDGLDFFRIGSRRLLFRCARERGLPVVTCAPAGFGAALLIFTPQSPGFDDFFAIDEGMTEVEQLARFAVGVAPAGLHVPYLDRSAVSLRDHRVPSSAVGVHLCAAIAATEVLNLLLKRGPVWAVPRYAHFDAYRRCYRRGTLRWGNRHPWQRLRLWFLKRQLSSDFSP